MFVNSSHAKFTPSVISLNYGWEDKMSNHVKIIWICHMYLCRYISATMNIELNKWLWILTYKMHTWRQDLWVQNIGKITEQKIQQMSKGHDRRQHGNKNGQHDDDDDEQSVLSAHLCQGTDTVLFQWSQVVNLVWMNTVVYSFTSFLSSFCFPLYQLCK